MFGSESVPIQLTFNEPLHHWTDYETGKLQFHILNFQFTTLNSFGSPRALAGHLHWVVLITSLKMKNMPKPSGNILKHSPTVIIQPLARIG